MNRAKVVERQVADKIKRQHGKGSYTKRGDKGEEVGEKRGGKFHELNNFASTNANPKHKRLKYHEIRSLPPDSKASEYGFDNCRHCVELGLDSNHIFYNCKNNPKWKPYEPKKSNPQRNLATAPSTSKQSKAK